MSIRSANQDDLDGQRITNDDSKTQSTPNAEATNVSQKVVVGTNFNVRVNIRKISMEELRKHGITRKQPEANIDSNINQEAPASTSRKRARTTINDEKSKRNRKVAKSSKLQLQQRMRNEAPTKEYLIGEIVLATIPGYVPWAARILNITGQTILVEFFGTGQK